MKSPASASHAWPKWLSKLNLFVFFSALVAFSWAELFVDVHATGFGDYQFFHHSWEAARAAWYGEGRVPLWNPFQCGGIPFWADPQAQFYHPLFALSGPLGTTLALKVFLCAHALLGCFGMYFLARRQGLLWFGAVAAATTWVGSGFFAWHCGTGHGNFIAFYLAPWVLLLWRLSVENVRYAPLLALTLSAVVFAGGAYAFPFFVLLLAIEATLQLVRPAIRKETRPDVFIAGSITVVLTLTLCALRLLPILEHLAYYPRNVSGTDSIRLGELVQMLTRNDVEGPGARFGGHPWVWSEYGSFIGWPALILGLVGAFRAAILGVHGRLLVGGVFFLSLTLGHAGLLSPWTLLHQLPVFDSLRVPTRFVVMFLLYFSLLLGSALDAWRAPTTRRIGRWASPMTALGWVRHAGPWLCLLWIGTSLVGHHRSVLDGMWKDPPAAVDSSKRSERFYIRVAPRAYESHMQHPAPPQFPSANVGTGYCYTGMAYRPAPGIWVGQTAQVRATPNGRVESWGSTTRSLWAVVTLQQPGRAIFNQTFSPGWRADTGNLMVDRGRIAVELPPGRHRVEVEYRPVLFPWAIVVSLVGCLLALLVGLFGARFKRLGQRVTLMAGCLGLAALVGWGYTRAPKWAHSSQVPQKYLPND